MGIRLELKGSQEQQNIRKSDFSALLTGKKDFEKQFFVGRSSVNSRPACICETLWAIPQIKKTINNS